MMSFEDNQLLTRVVGDAPMGRMMRRHWVPALMAEEVSERDGKPVRVRLFGENLVAFRGTDGRVGLIGELCPHRRASLALARNEECGLRCLYHGWKIDADGNVVDMPSEPAGTPMLTKVKQPAYPTIESGGFVWAYMGPPETKPEFVPPPWADDPANSIAIVKIHESANWAQSVEGSLDSAHSSTLHSTNITSDAKVAGSTDRGVGEGLALVRPSTDKAPRIRVQYTSYGLRYAAIRKPILNAEIDDYVRVTVFIAPFITLIPPHSTWRSAQLFVPSDDENTMFYFIAWSNQIAFTSEAWRRDNYAVPGVDLDANWRKKRTLVNDFLQDREAMKKGDFTGIAGVPNQDMAVQESMGSIVDRTSENLGASDIAVVRFRQMMLAAVRSFMSGGPAIGTDAPVLPRTRIKSFEGIVPKTEAWKSLGVTPDEIASYRDTLPGADYNVRVTRDAPGRAPADMQ